MNILSILAGPNQEFSFDLFHKFNSSLDLSNHKLESLDLYGLKFNPVFIPEYSHTDEVLRFQQKVNEANVLIFFYPIWNFGLPAVLKGFLDRIFLEGFAYRTSNKMSKGLLGSKRAIIITTSTVANWQLKYLYGDNNNMFWKRGILQISGIRNVYSKNFDLISNSLNQRKLLALEEVKLIAEEI